MDCIRDGIARICNGRIQWLSSVGRPCSGEILAYCRTRPLLVVYIDSEQASDASHCHATCKKQHTHH